jgi:hypothetical protein
VSISTKAIQARLLGLSFFNSKPRYSWCYECVLHYSAYRWATLLTFHIRMGTLGVRMNSTEAGRISPSRSCCLFNFEHFRKKSLTASPCPAVFRTRFRYRTNRDRQSARWDGLTFDTKGGFIIFVEWIVLSPRTLHLRPWEVPFFAFGIVERGPIMTPSTRLHCRAIAFTGGRISRQSCSYNLGYSRRRGRWRSLRRPCKICVSIAYLAGVDTA